MLQVTLPLRFATKTMHFIAVLTVVFDFTAITSRITGINPRTDTLPQDLAFFNSHLQTLSAISYAAIACFAVEYVSLFLGVSMFLNHVMALNILAHSAGLILTVLFYINGWTLSSYIAFFVVFNAAPMLLEVFTLFFLSRFSFMKY
ncbi:MAG: hypothetical protein WDW38_006774 [Sanguina aurantia]